LNLFFHSLSCGEFDEGRSCLATLAWMDLSRSY
jgi:hypothetical protein